MTADDQQEVALANDDESLQTSADTKASAGKGKGKRTRKPKVTKEEAEPVTVEIGDVTKVEDTDVNVVAESTETPAPKKPRKRAGVSAKSKAAKAHTEALVAKALAEQPVGDVSVTRVLYIEENAPAQAQTQIKTIQRVQKKRKQLDLAKTQEKYRARMLQKRTPEDWASLNGAWLSDYKLYTNEAKMDHSAHHGNIIIELAKNKGIDVKGLCAENVKRYDTPAPDGTITRERRFVQDPLPDGTPRASATIVYIVNQNRFTDHDQSIWSCKLEETWIQP